MKKQYRYIFITILLFGVLWFGLDAFAQYGLDETAGAADLKKYGGNVSVLIGRVIGAGLSMVSVIFFALMIYGGIRYMLARGNEESTKKAINTIWAAVIGILIVLASYALTQFVFSSLGAGNGGGGGGTPGLNVGKWCVAGSGDCEQIDDFMSDEDCTFTPADPSNRFDTAEACNVASGDGTAPPGDEGTTAPPGPVCGNGTKEGTEQCDDNNTSNGDGCDDQCNQGYCVIANTAFCGGFTGITAEADCNSATKPTPSGGEFKACEWDVGLSGGECYPLGPAETLSSECIQASKTQCLAQSYACKWE